MLTWLTKGKFNGSLFSKGTVLHDFFTMLLYSINQFNCSGLWYVYRLNIFVIDDLISLRMSISTHRSQEKYYADSQEVRIIYSPHLIFFWNKKKFPNAIQEVKKVPKVLYTTLLVDNFHCMKITQDNLRVKHRWVQLSWSIKNAQKLDHTLKETLGVRLGSSKDIREFRSWTPKYHGHRGVRLQFKAP
jgi:hypothetical protein